MPAEILPSAFQALYSDYFSEAMHDVFNHDYAAMLAPYDMPLQANATCCPQH